MFFEETYLSFLKTEKFGRNITALEKTESTSAYMLENDLGDFSVATAERQTKGRGRSGRLWASEDSSNLYFSVQLPISEPSLLLPFNIAAGFAVSDALGGILPVKIKWPNDIFCRGKKLGGILFETSVSGSRLEKVVLGIGINVNMTSVPTELQGIATSMRLETGRDFSKEEVLADVMLSLENIWRRFSAEALDIAAEWGAYSASLDKTVTVHKNGVKSAYTEKGITSSGFLIAEDSFGVRTEIVTGDIGYDFSG
jgi:BirA family biotin operon repressor/biotin-[acetyl-CoA-carboxylase] ligase